MVKLIDNSIES